jgi:hypothetical protein
VEPTPAPAQEVQVSGRKKRLALVGFRPGTATKATEVFIRTNEPVHYSVSDDGQILRVVVQNTRVMRHNDLRPLDTHFFVTPVSLIVARQVRHDVVVEIRLKSRSPYRAVQEGDEVRVDFEPARSAQRTPAPSWLLRNAGNAGVGGEGPPGLSRKEPRMRGDWRQIAISQQPSRGNAAG